MREVVSLARQLDKAAHIASRKGANRTLRKQLAEDMELPTDSDESDADSDGGREDEEARRRRVREEKQAATQRAALARLLGRLDRPTGLPVHEAVRRGWGGGEGPGE